MSLSTFLRRTDVALTLRWCSAAVLVNWAVLTLGLVLLLHALRGDSVPEQLVTATAERAIEAAPLVSTGREDAIEAWRMTLQQGAPWTLSRWPWVATPEVRAVALSSTSPCGELAACVREGEWITSGRVDAGHVLVVTFDGAKTAATLGPIGAQTAIVLLLPLSLVTGGLGAALSWGLSRRFRRRVEGLLATIDGWAQGAWGLRPPPSAGDDELARVSARLVGLIEQLAKLSAGEVAAARDTLLRALHDDVKQDLFAASLQLALAPDRSGPVALARSSIARAQAGLGAMLSRRPPGAVAAASLAELVAGLATAWSRAVECQRLDEPPPGVAGALVRAATKEALINAFRHGAPGPVSLTVTRSAELACVEVVNPGQVRLQAPRGGLGWLERDLARAGGRLELTSAGPRLVRFRAELPLTGAP